MLYEFIESINIKYQEVDSERDGGGSFGKLLVDFDSIVEESFLIKFYVILLMLLAI